MKKILRNVLLILGFIIISTISILVAQGYQMYKVAINNMPLDQKIAEIQSRDNYVTVDELPQIYKDAVLTIEDKRFYQHHGVDILAIIRALGNDILAMAPVEGGSTITQQIAKNEYFTQDKELTRKIAEVFLAFDLEKDYSKDEIFEIYVNTIYFGEGYYGISQASEGYFNIPASEMNEYQSTLLAGVPNAPSVYAPTVNPQLAAERQEQVLKRLIKNKIISEEEADKIRSTIFSKFLTKPFKKDS